LKTQKHDIDASSSRAKVWTALFTATWAGLIGMVSNLVPTAAILLLPMTIVVTVGAVLVTAAFTFVLTWRKRGSSRIVKLKKSLATAYINALEESPLNPANGGLQ
jgi:protein-S-isoprenylcysteine O-methyltransferase Ste14